MRFAFLCFGVCVAGDRENTRTPERIGSTHSMASRIEWYTRLERIGSLRRLDREHHTHPLKLNIDVYSLGNVESTLTMAQTHTNTYSGFKHLRERVSGPPSPAVGGRETALEPRRAIYRYTMYMFQPLSTHLLKT